MLKTQTAALVLALAGCQAFGGSGETIVKQLEIIEPVAYWSVRGKVEGTTRIYPVLRFRVRNGGTAAAGVVQAMAVFRRASAPREGWGNAFTYSISREAIPPGGASPEVVMRSDSNYLSKDEPRQMFQSKGWEQVTVEVFLKASDSSWTSRLVMEVPQRVGAPGVEEFKGGPDS